MVLEEGLKVERKNGIKVKIKKKNGVAIEEIT